MCACLRAGSGIIRSSWYGVLPRISGVRFNQAGKLWDSGILGGNLASIGYATTAKAWVKAHLPCALL